MPQKNIKVLNGVPLICYSIDVARQFASDEHICVSTDDAAIRDTVIRERQLEVPFMRPDYLATDEASTYDVLLHALDFYQLAGRTYEAIVLLQPTSPLRQAMHVREALVMYEESAPDMVVSVKETKSNPYFTLFEENADGFLVKSKSGNFSRRQDCPKVYEYNGAVYVINVASLRKSILSEFKHIRKYVMDDVSSVDVDTPLDWDIADMLIRKQHGL